MSVQDSIPASKKYFGERALGYDEHRELQQAFHKDQYVLRQFLSAVVRPGSRILDVACGTNRLSLLVRELGGSYHGVDASSDMVSIAKSKDPDADIVVADAREIPHPSGSFDVVVTLKFLKWVPSDDLLRPVLAEISRVLRVGGVALLHQKVTGDPPLKVRLRQMILRLLKRGKRARGPGTRAMDEHAFVAMCEDAGLELRSVTATSELSGMSAKPSFNAFYILEKV